MKFIIYFTLFITLLLNSYAQERRKMDNKIEQLEKLKLIEALNLNEEQSVRFFARRNEHRKEIEKLESRADELIKIMEDKLNESAEKDAVELKRMLNEYLDIRIQIENKRKQFILSLNDILSLEQINKLLIFEKRFKDEIRKILMKRKGFPKD